METSQNYTYLHTLSLHNALPIYGDLSAEALAGFRRRDDHRTPGAKEGGVDRGRLVGIRQRRVGHDNDVGKAAAVLDLFRLAARHRSEEHTSELQSLMRNSTAICRLTNK